MPSSLSYRRPVNGEAICGSYPEWVLLDTVATGALYHHSSDAMALAFTRTTASVVVKSENKAGVEVDVIVEVSFSLVNPPDVSSFVVHCHGLRDDGLPFHACVVSAQGNVVLLYIILDRYKPGLYFVYSVGQGNPLLEVLPPSHPFQPINAVGILPNDRGGSEGYVVATIRRVITDGILKYQLFRYSSNTKAWSTKVAPLNCDCEDDLDDLLNHCTDKVIAVGSSLGWVDLWWGILVCDVLNEENPSVRFIELPDPMPHNEHWFGTSSARSCRDVICSGDLVKFVEVEYHRGDYAESSNNGAIDYGWKATAWHKDIFSYSFADWQQSFTIDTDDITVTDERYSYLLPQLWNGNAKKLSLEKFMCSFPNLSLDDDVFYMKSTLNPTSPLAWLAAVNMKGNLLHLVPFTAESFHWDPTYRPCNFSKYLNTTPGQHMTVVKDSRRLRDLTKGHEPSELLTPLCVEKWLKEQEGCILQLERPNCLTAYAHLSSQLKHIQESVVSSMTGLVRANNTGYVDTLIRPLYDNNTAMFQVAKPCDVHPTTPDQTPEIKLSCALEAKKSLLQDAPSKWLAKERAEGVQDNCVLDTSFSLCLKNLTDHPVCSKIRQEVWPQPNHMLQHLVEDVN